MRIIRINEIRRHENEGGVIFFSEMGRRKRGTPPHHFGIIHFESDEGGSGEIPYVGEFPIGDGYIIGIHENGRRLPVKYRVKL